MSYAGFDSEAEAWAWATGLFEGEGYITFTRTDESGYNRWIGLNMTDEDVVRRFYAVVGAGCEPYARPPRQAGWKALWIWKCARWIDLERILTRMLPMLGERRGARAREMLAHPPAANRKGKTHCVRGHPLSGDNERIVYNGGRRRRLCLACVSIHNARGYEKRKARAKAAKESV